MREPLLVLNAGSSSLKFSVFETLLDRSLVAGAHGSVESLDRASRLVVRDSNGSVIADRPAIQLGYHGAIEVIHRWFADHIGSESGFDGIGHRVVHGGEHYQQPVRIDNSVLEIIASLCPLAPLHQPHHVEAIRAVSAIAPGVPQVACFDTAFHHTLSELEREFALPQVLTQKGIRRYGFHGLSYEYIASVYADLQPSWSTDKVVVAHLGSGASMCALRDGKSVGTTMGFTAVDGLPMSTRTGSLDPGVILYLLKQEGMSVDEVERLIYEQAGLLGVSGISSDMRTLLESNSPSAVHAVQLFAYRAARELGSLVSLLGGLDALIFTAGIGEHAPTVRDLICRRSAWLGIELDSNANEANRALISSDDSKVSVLVIPTDENLMIAKHTRRLLDADR